MTYMQGTARFAKDSKLSELPMVAFSYTNVSEVQEALTKLKQKEMESSLHLLAHASHELRNPLNGILGLTKVLIDSDTSGFSEEQLHNLQVIEQCGEELLRHVENLLLMSKMESNVLPVAHLPMNVRDVVSEVVQMIEARKSVPEREGKGWSVAIKSDIDDTVPAWILSDVGHIKSILINLVSNALKATAQGNVTVQVKRSRAIDAATHTREESTASTLSEKSDISTILLSSAHRTSEQPDADEWLEFRVIDTGCGIPSDKIGALFRPYSQIESTYARTYQGTGLGLSITKSLVTAMGGRIGVQSQVGQGSEFWFIVPAPVPRESPGRELSAPFSTASSTGLPDGWDPRLTVASVAELGKCTKIPLASKCPIQSILCVEDNSVNLKVLTTFLKQLGYDSNTATDGQAAWNMMALKRYQLVFSDIAMPIMDGSELLALIRKEAKEKQPFVCVLSGGALESNVLKEQGPDLFLMKPLKKEVLANAMQQAHAWLRTRQEV